MNHHERLTTEGWKIYSELQGNPVEASHKQARDNTLVIDGLFSTVLTGDGVAAISDSHPLKSGGTFSNIGAANADLNETSLEAAVIQIADWTDERGLRISVQPKRMIIPNGLQFTAERLLRTPNRVGTNDNDISAIRSMSSIPDGYRVNNYISDPRSWFILSNISEGPTFWSRRPLDIDEGEQQRLH